MHALLKPNSSWPTEIESQFNPDFVNLSWCKCFQSEKPIKTPLPIHFPGTYQINEETFVENFDLPQTFILEFDFKLELKGYHDETILVGMKFERFQEIAFKSPVIEDVK